MDQPSAYARAVETVGVLARNLTYLLNALRSHQVGPPADGCTFTDLSDMGNLPTCEWELCQGWWACAQVRHPYVLSERAAS